MGYNRKRTDEMLNRILDFAEIGEFIHQPLKNYSSGMKARLFFAVSVNINPDILILDEILSVGDELFRRKCYARMDEFFKAGKTILFVSHSVQTINQMCTRAILLNSGEIILEGPTKMVTAQYERYLFAKLENQPAVRQEIILMNQDQLLKEATYHEIEKGKQKEAYKNIPSKEKSKAIDSKVGRQAADIVKQKAYFIPNLVPKSRVEYRDYDINISDVCILTPEGEKVNVLLTGEKYIYKYKVSFNIDAEYVVFGMMIKTEKGLEICGTNNKNFDTMIEKVLKNETYNISWTFTCNFLQGNYYTNAGVSEYKDGKHIYLNRVIDAMTFKVQQPDKILYNGIVYIGQTLEILIE